MNLYQISDRECWCLSIGKNQSEAKENAWNKCFQKELYEEMLINEDEYIRKGARKCKEIKQVQDYKIQVVKR